MHDLQARLEAPRLRRCLGYGATERSRARLRGSERAQVARLADAVEKLRGLRFDHPVKPKFLSRKQITRRIVEPSFGSHTQDYYELEQRILRALGLMFGGADLRSALFRSARAGLGGYYVPSTQRLVVRSSGGGFTPEEQIILAHELEHALVYQRLDPAPPVLGGGDAVSASQALIEGDATLTMHRYGARYLDREEVVPFLRLAKMPHAPAGDAELPHYVREEAMFPYARGLAFLCYLYGRGGWTAVNSAYRSPPATTAQVLWPARYTRREGAIPPAAAGSLPRPWVKAATRDFGAANLLWLFEAPADDPARALKAPLDRAAGWAGGALDLWVRTAKGSATLGGTASLEAAVGIRLVQRKGETPLCDSMKQWYRATFPGTKRVDSRGGEVLAARSASTAASIRCTGRNVSFGSAPSLRLARSLLD